MTVKKRLGRNYYFLKYYNKSKLAIYSLLRQEPIIIYQMGKVGSTSLVSSIRRSAPTRAVYHIHTLNREELEMDMKRYKAGMYYVPGHNYYAGLTLCKALERGNPEKTWRVISLVRDPIARNISAFFQNIRLFVPDYSPTRYMGLANVKRLTEVFLEKFPHLVPLDYFDSEIKRFLGIDIFSKPFPRSEGFATYEGPFSDLLVLRLEDLNRVAGTIIPKFAGLERFSLQPSNVAEQKDYIRTYKKFRQLIKLPNRYIEQMYNSRMARYFYSENELSGFRDKWCRPLTN